MHLTINVNACTVSNGMNTILRRSIVLLLAVLMAITAIAPKQADAKIFDWFRSGNSADSSTDPAVNNWSFDAIFDSLRNAASPDMAITIQGNAVIQTSSPVTPDTQTAPKTRRSYTVELSAYSSTPDQTDDSPFITAKGTYVRDGIVAANFLPFGTAIKIPEIFGDKIFVVEDRMNRRYTRNVDIWFPDRTAAMQFGRKTATIEVVSS